MQLWWGGKVYNASAVTVTTSVSLHDVFKFPLAYQHFFVCHVVLVASHSELLIHTYYEHHCVLSTTYYTLFATHSSLIAHHPLLTICYPPDGYSSEWYCHWEVCINSTSIFE